MQECAEHTASNIHEIVGTATGVMARPRLGVRAAQPVRCCLL